MASLSNRRSMFIDDNFDDVQYSGNWFLDTYERPGPFQFVGMTAKRTAHGTNTTGGFAFSFEGTSVSIEGQSNVIPATTNSALSCTVDGADASSDVVTSNNLRSWHLCAATGLSAGRHDVVVNVTAGANTVFWLDEIYYWSLPNPNLRRKYSMFLANTGEFRYTGVSWSNPFDNDGLLGRETYANGAKVTIPFYGVSLELTAYLTSQMPRAAGSGSYSIDGGPAVPFPIPAWTAGFRGMPSNETIWRVGLFTTPVVSPGQHTVEVINLGNAQTAPLSIDYVYVQHGDVDASTATLLPPVVGSGQSITRTSTSTSSRSTGTGASVNDAPGQGQKTPLGPIIGGVVGGIVVLAITGFLIFFCLKRRKEAPGTETRLTPQEAQALSMQSRNLAVATGVYGASNPTPPAYTPSAVGPEHYITPLALPPNTSYGVPTRAIPPEKQRRQPETSLTYLNRGMASSSSFPSHGSPPASVAPQSHYGTASDYSQSTNSSGQASGPPPPLPRRLPPRLPPLKGSDPRLNPDR